MGEDREGEGGVLLERAERKEWIDGRGRCRKR